LVVFLLLLSLVFPLLLPFSVLFLFFFSFFFCQFLPTCFSPLSFPLSSLFASFGLNFRWEESVKERHATEHAAAADRHWEEEGHLLSLSLHLYFT
jgi:hypothetical protein